MAHIFRRPQPSSASMPLRERLQQHPLSIAVGIAVATGAVVYAATGNLHKATLDAKEAAWKAQEDQLKATHASEAHKSQREHEKALAEHEKALIELRTRLISIDRGIGAEVGFLDVTKLQLDRQKMNRLPKEFKSS